MANSCGKFPQQILMTNSQICYAEHVVVYHLCRRASGVKIERKQVTKQKLLRLKKPLHQRWLKLEDLIIQTFLKLAVVENDWHLLYLLYQLSNYYPEGEPNMNLMCLIVI